MTVKLKYKNGVQNADNYLQDFLHTLEFRFSLSRFSILRGISVFGMSILKHNNPKNTINLTDDDKDFYVKNNKINAKYPLKSIVLKYLCHRDNHQ